MVSAIRVGSVKGYQSCRRVVRFYYIAVICHKHVKSSNCDHRVVIHEFSYLELSRFEHEPENINSVSQQPINQYQLQELFHRTFSLIR